MNQFYLKTLDTMVVLPSEDREVQVIYDREIRDYQDYVSKRDVQRGLKMPFLERVPLIRRLFNPERGTQGMNYIDRTSSKTISSLISWRLGLDEDTKCLTGGHEEGHLLDELLGFLYSVWAVKEIGNHHGLEFKKWPWFNEEARADAYGLVALKRQIDTDNTKKEAKEARFIASVLKQAAWSCHIDPDFEDEPVLRKTFKLVHPKIVFSNWLKQHEASSITA
jgi:hypothetical protein